MDVKQRRREPWMFICGDSVFIDVRFLPYFLEPLEPG